MKHQNLPVSYIDPQTGQLVYPVTPNQQAPMTHIQPHYPIQSPPPAQHTVMQVPPAPTPREYHRRESKARFAGSFFGMFIMSWIPCVVGLPGLTLLIWGFLAAYTFYRACR